MSGKNHAAGCGALPGKENVVSRVTGSPPPSVRVTACCRESEPATAALCPTPVSSFLYGSE